MATSRRVLLKGRPVGEPRVEDFEVEDAPVPEPGPGQVLLRTIYLSLDPYMRGRMNEGPSYTGTPNPSLGEVMVGGTVSEVVHSNNDRFAAGDLVAGSDGWRSHSVSSGAGLRKLDPKAAPISTALGVLGMPGLTAYVGLLDIGRPKAGETVVVSAAAGAVGSAVGQIAKIKGCRAVGVAGGRAKCEHVVKELGFDECVDYKSQDVFTALQARLPEGHRRLLRQRRRTGARCGDAPDQPRRPHFDLRPHLRVQRHGATARAESRPILFNRADRPRLHRERSRGPVRRVPSRDGRLGAGGPPAVPRGHRARAWRMRRAPSSACCAARTSASV